MVIRETALSFGDAGNGPGGSGRFYSYVAVNVLRWLVVEKKV